MFTYCWSILAEIWCSDFLVCTWEKELKKWLLMQIFYLLILLYFLIYTKAANGSPFFPRQCHYRRAWNVHASLTHERLDLTVFFCIIFAMQTVIEHTMGMMQMSTSWIGVILFAFPCYIHSVHMCSANHWCKRGLHCLHTYRNTSCWQCRSHQTIDKDDGLVHLGCEISIIIMWLCFTAYHNYIYILIYIVVRTSIY